MKDKQKLKRAEFKLPVYLIDMLDNQAFTENRSRNQQAITIFKSVLEKPAEKHNRN